MLTLPVVAILLGLNIILTGYIVWEHYKKAKLASKQPPITLDSVSVIIDHALERTVANSLAQGSNFFTEKLEKTYDANLKNSIDDVQKNESRLNSQADNLFATLEESFKSHIFSLEATAKSQIELLNKKTADSEANFEKFLQNLNTISQKSQFESMEGAKVKVDKLFEDFEIKLADFLLQSEQKMMLAVDLELRSARQLIDTYKVQQMNVIDENIMAMLEKTLSLVLAKNLNLKDQMDFVYESLEKAKAEKFVV